MFAIPTLPDLVERARRAFRDYLPGSDAWLWPNNIGPSAKVMAGAVFEVFGFADYIAKQKFAGTADSENLDLHAAEIGVAPRKPAAPARGNVRLTSTDDLTVDPGALFSRADGIQYRTLAGGSRTGAGTLDIDSIATTNAKMTSALAATPLDIISGVTDVNGDALAEVGPDGIVGGTDIEIDGEDWTTDLGTLRGRILFRKRYPPHGGAAADYVMWATSLIGVTRVFVERLWNGPGSVRVFVLMDDLYADGIPPSGEILRVRDFIETVRPSGAVVTIAAPVAHPIDITITGLTPNTSATQEAVLAELRETFLRLSRVAGTDELIGGMPFLAYPFSFPRGWIWQAVGNAGGVISDAVTTPSSDPVMATGEIPTLGTVTFV